MRVCAGSNWLRNIHARVNCMLRRTCQLVSSTYTTSASQSREHTSKYDMEQIANQDRSPNLRHSEAAHLGVQDEVEKVGDVVLINII